MHDANILPIVKITPTYESKKLQQAETENPASPGADLGIFVREGGGV